LEHREKSKTKFGRPRQKERNVRLLVLKDVPSGGPQNTKKKGPREIIRKKAKTRQMNLVMARILGG